MQRNSERTHIDLRSISQDDERYRLAIHVVAIILFAANTLPYLVSSKHTI
jgi:hypothetical protein